MKYSFTARFSDGNAKNGFFKEYATRTQALYSLKNAPETVVNP